jgi:hypothetical protein
MPLGKNQRELLCAAEAGNFVSKRELTDMSDGKNDDQFV